MLDFESAPGRCQETDVQNPTVQNPEQNHQLHWGDALRKKQPGMARIVFQNPAGLGVHTNSIKTYDLQQFIMDKDIDLIGMGEINVNWGKVAGKHSIWNRVRPWFESSRVAAAYNIRDRFAKRAQRGGSAQITQGRLSHRVLETGRDPKGLGRWVWQRLRGKHNTTTRIVSAYRPCMNTGSQSVYQQQLRALTADGITTCPRSQFWIDLAVEIEKWKDAGDQLVIMGDWNEPVTDLKPWFDHLGLHNLHTDRHGDEDLPATHIRGSRTIDGVFVTPTIQPYQCGFMAFDEGPGDHRALWFDIPLDTILGFNMSELQSFGARRLKLEDPRVVDRYLRTLHKYCIRHNVYNRFAALETITSYPLSQALIIQYDELDRIREKGMRKAEKACRRLHTGTWKWSPEFEESRQVIKLWTLVRRKLQGGRINTRKLLRLRHRLDILNTHVTLGEVEAQLNSSWDRYRLAKTNAESNSRAYRENLAVAKAAAGQGSAASHLRSLNDREAQRDAARHIKAVTKKIDNCSTTQVIVIRDDGSTVEITEKHAMENAIMHENEKKYHQCEGACPLLEGRLLQDIGLLGDGPAAASILDGTYVPPPDTDRGTALFLQALKRPPNVTQAPANTLTSFKRGWKLVKEKTSSGRLHFGHFKAGCQHPLISWLHFGMSELPFTSGFTPARWRKGTDVMLLKKSGDYRLDKLRTIVLYEADFNFQNKQLGRSAMRQALQYSQIADEQYSRPGRGAIEHVLNRQLVFDNMRYRKQTYSMCSCDLKGCYDRIIHAAASLALQRVGIPLTRIKAMFSTIQTLIHTVRTAYGDSSTSYGGLSDMFLHPPHGVGQGNGAGPAVWSVLSSTVFFALRQQGFGIKFLSALSKDLFHLCGFAYVDDADLVEEGDTPVMAHGKMRGALAIWESVIKATGGALAPDKSWWYLVEFVWNHGEWTHSDAGDALDLVAHDRNGRPHSLEYLSNNVASQMLGVWLAPNGDHSKQLEVMSLKVLQWTELLRVGHLSRNETWTALNSGILKALAYPLPALTLSEDECQTLMVPLIEAAFPRCGISKKMARAVRYGPKSYGGFGVDNIFLSQGASKIQYIIEHLWKNTPTGRLIRNTAESLSLEANVTDIFTSPYPTATWIRTTSWIHSAWKFMSQSAITFDKSPVRFKPRRQGDRPLMEAIASICSSSTMLYRANTCRIFLQISHISDLTSGDGRNLRLSLLGKPRSPPSAISYRNDFNWPPQPLPPPSWFSTFRSLVKRALVGESTALTQPLGDWLLDRDTYFSTWDWFIDTASSFLWHHSDDGWFRHIPLPNRRARSKKFFVDSLQCDAPEQTSLERTTVRLWSPTVYWCEGSAAYHLPPPPQPPPDGEIRELFGFHLSQQPDSCWACSNLTMSPSISQLSRDFIQGQCVAVSDGSYLPTHHQSSAAWIIESADRTEFIRGGGILPGNDQCQDPYRGELGGIFGITIVLHCLHACLPGSNPIIIACDGISALRAAMVKSADKLSTSHPSFDLISAIKGYWNLLPFDCAAVHVRGHQDDVGRDLTRLEQMNVEMDEFAKSILQTFLDRNLARPDSSFHLGFLQISIHGKPVHSRLHSAITESHTLQPLLDLWTRRGNVPTTQLDNIAWTPFGRALKRRSTQKGHFIIKWLANDFAIGSVMRRRKARHGNRCPRCDAWTENRLHCVTCPHRDAIKCWNNNFDEFTSFLEDEDTEPDLLSCLTHSILLWHSSPHQEIAPLPTWSDAIKNLFYAQSAIGWFSFCQGFISTEMMDFQSHHYLSISSRRSGPSWAAKVIQQLWLIIDSMWEHRNKALHHTPIIHEREGLQFLKTSSAAELGKGLSLLPPLYRSFFTHSLEHLMEKSTEDLLCWFHTVRLAREVTGQSAENDEFSTNGPLRAWVGLPIIPPQEIPDDNP